MIRVFAVKRALLIFLDSGMGAFCGVAGAVSCVIVVIGKSMGLQV